MSRQRKICINVFIVINILSILIAPPESIKVINSFQKPFYYYALWTRLLQKWRLFTPTPRKNAMYYKAEITFADGTQATWRRPLPGNWNFFQRHLCYNWQKFDSALLNMEEPVFRDDIVNFLVHQDEFSNKKVKKIRLVKMEAQWPPPNPVGYVFIDDSLLRWFERTIFTYDFEAKRFI